MPIMSPQLRIPFGIATRVSPRTLCGVVFASSDLTFFSDWGYFWAQGYAQVIDSLAASSQNDKTGDFSAKTRQYSHAKRSQSAERHRPGCFSSAPRKPRAHSAHH